MTEIFSTVFALLALVVALAAVVVVARRDSFAGPGTAHRPSDELGPFGFRRRQA